MKHLLIATLLFISISIIAQDLTITFTAQGETTVIDKIIATNLTTDESITIPGNETLLLHSVTTKINTPKTDNDIVVFPNPYNSYTNINFQNDNHQKVTVTITNLSGTTITLFEQNLSNGTHTLQVSAKNPGIYLLSVETPSGISSTKIVQTLSGQNRITYSKKISHETHLKSETSDYVLNYSTGNIISYNIISGNMSTIINGTPTTSQTINATLVECKDIDDNSYSVVKLGDQIWMAENLKTIRYADSTQIPTETYNYLWGDFEDNNTDKYYCYYNNNWSGEKDIYGTLYTYAAAINGTPQADSSDVVQGVCPNGWHLPSKYEWKIMGDYLIANGYNYDYTTTMNRIGKSLASTTLWAITTSVGQIGKDLSINNRSGFTALPAGHRSSSDGVYNRLGTKTYFWSSTEYNNSSAFCCGLGSFDTNLSYYIYGGPKSGGYSIRCVRD